MQGPLLALFILFDVLALLWLIRRCTRPKGAPPAPPTAAMPPRVATHEVEFVDVNNVRGRTHFDSDVNERCCSICRWAAGEPESTAIVVAVDHGPKLQAFVLHSERLGGRVVVTFAGRKLEADDTIVRGVGFCRARLERVMVVTSDCGLRRRCTEAGLGDGDDAHVAMVEERPARRRKARAGQLRGHNWVAFENSATFTTLLPDVRRDCAPDDIETLLLGPSPKSSSAAAAARWKRRERSGKKTELTADRQEQANTLFEQLTQAVVAGRASVPSGTPASADADATPAERARAAVVAHACWVNAGCVMTETSSAA